MGSPLPSTLILHRLLTRVQRTWGISEHFEAMVLTYLAKEIKQKESSNQKPRNTSANDITNIDVIKAVGLHSILNSAPKTDTKLVINTYIPVQFHCEAHTS